MSPTSNDNHYSYSIYADPATAKQFDQSHFGGPIGELIVELQERVLIDFVGDVRHCTVLDVGTGTGRAALAIARCGAKVTGVDASSEMLKVAKAHAEETRLQVTFLPGDAHALDFPDQSFDVAVSLRMLMHTPDWRRCLGELCRVSRRRIVFDFPPLVSAAALQVLMRRLAQILGRTVEAYHVIGTKAVQSVLLEHGFKVVNMNRQFVLPVAFHKMVGSRRFTEGTEKMLVALGLLRLMGSPVTIVAERRSG